MSARPLPEDVLRFLDTATPAVPVRVRRVLLEDGAAGQPGDDEGPPAGWSGAEVATSGRGLAESLTAAALPGMRKALEVPPRDRRGAFRLLEADALLTWACEAAADDEDPGASLLGILRRVAGGDR